MIKLRGISWRQPGNREAPHEAKRNVGCKEHQEKLLRKLRNDVCFKFLLLREHLTSAAPAADSLLLLVTPHSASLHAGLPAFLAAARKTISTRSKKRFDVWSPDLDLDLPISL